MVAAKQSAACKHERAGATANATFYSATNLTTWAATLIWEATEFGMEAQSP
jgi:hypothetical protein